MTTRTILFVVIAATWAGLHNLALILELYWRFWWFDIPMHFVGGVVVALGLLVLSDLRVPLPLYRPTVVVTTAFVLFVALAWEVFEVWAGIPIESDYWFDTSLDVLLGLGGGLVGYVLGQRLSEL
jgi:hypothetical protein